MRCLAHRLKLAVKYAFSGSFFNSTNDMLLRLLEGIIIDQKEYFKFDDAGVR